MEQFGLNLELEVELEVFQLVQLLRLIQKLVQLVGLGLMVTWGLQIFEVYLSEVLEFLVFIKWLMEQILVQLMENI